VLPDLDPPPPGATGDGSYVEQLRVPLRWWAVATMFWASVLLALLVAIPVPAACAIAGFFFATNALIFVAYGAARVTIDDGVFEAGRASIPVHLLADPEALDASAARRAAGVDADARAYLVIRPYAAQAVRVRVVDPSDPTPYWLVSTRHPRTLAAELSAAIGVSS
jgi:Protein of unknown function (DUF3093)